MYLLGSGWGLFIFTFLTGTTCLWGVVGFLVFRGIGTGPLYFTLCVSLIKMTESSLLNSSLEILVIMGSIVFSSCVLGVLILALWVGQEVKERSEVFKFSLKGLVGLMTPNKWFLGADYILWHRLHFMHTDYILTHQWHFMDNLGFKK